MQLVKDTLSMIAEMKPALQPGEFVFCSTRSESLKDEALAVALASFAEEGGISLILPLEEAERLRFPVSLKMRQITLKVFSSLEGIGLTAAVSDALTMQRIPCNIVAATHHDHVFVPSPLADAAVEVLLDLQSKAAGKIQDG